MTSIERSRAWTFTLNNHHEKEVNFPQIEKNLQECRYYIMGFEVAPETGTQHIQGYLYCANAISFNTVRAWFLGKAHIEKARGSIKQNYDYCSKDGKFVEHGIRPLSDEEKGVLGKESQQVKWREIWELSKAGKINELAEQYPKETLFHFKNILLIRQIGADGCADLSDVCGLWFHGESGAGKSHRARHFDTDETPYIKGINKWWCNYVGQKTVIIEDVGKDHTFLGDFLKIWADKWAFTAEFKGGAMARMRPKQIIVTSQYRIADIWPDIETRTALERRFKEEEIIKGPLDILLRATPASEPESSSIELLFPGVGAQEIEITPLENPEEEDDIEEADWSEQEKEARKEDRKRKREHCPFIESEAGCYSD